jgi:hypothetical protein
MDQIFDRSLKVLARPVSKYIPARATIVFFRIAWFTIQLETHPLAQTNDPHPPEVLEPEHANT